MQKFLHEVGRRRAENKIVVARGWGGQATMGDGKGLVNWYKIIVRQEK
jgi:hypothetical protein